jgi:transposase
MRTKIKYPAKERQKLLRLAKGRNTAYKVVLRARIVLSMMAGLNKKEIAEGLGTSRPTVYLWIKRYQEGGIEAILKDASRPGRLPRITEEKEKEIVEATLQTVPENATHWSVRLMAEAQKVSRMTVYRIWKKYNLKPHLVKKFKLSNDPHFVAKVKDIVGLYLNPPDRAMVLCVDEKSQIQALDRSQPGLPLKTGHAATMPHDYKRHGTTTLFAALNVLDGKVIGECMPRHRQNEFLRFLRRIDKETPNNTDLHLIVDNYGSHKTQKVKAWLKRHPHFNLHFTPTSSSWLNMVEIFFGQLTREKIKRGVFHSVKQLENSIMDYIGIHNENPTKYIWTKNENTILSKVNKCKDSLGTVH